MRPRSDSWALLARCRVKSWRLFFRDARKEEEAERRAFQRARVVCLACPVQRECLEWAMSVEAQDEARMAKEDGENVEWLPTPHRLREGMLGGLTPRERVRVADQGWTLTKALLYSEGQLTGPVVEEVSA